jgi:hypothetical protein
METAFLVCGKLSESLIKFGFREKTIAENLY